MWSPFWRSLKTNAPVPVVGSALNGPLVRSAELARACLGRMGMLIAFSRNEQAGALRLTVSVIASGTSIDAIWSKLLLYGLAFLASRIMSSVNLASSAVNG